MRRMGLFVAGLFVLGVVMAASAFADPYTAPPSQAPTVPPSSFHQTSREVPSTGANGTQVLGIQFTRNANGGFLASTGFDIAGTAFVGLLLIGGGVVLVRRSRASSPASPA